MKRSVRAYLELIRLPNVFTAAADVLAGFLLAGGGIAMWRSAALLCAASACLYAGGVALNDVCDVEMDLRHRQDRPIPSGRVSKFGARVLVVTLLIAGVALAACVSLQTLWLASLLVVSILLYDAVLKMTMAAPGLMGLCRALNLAMGIGAFGWLLTPATLLAVGSMGVYVTSLTLFARRETSLGLKRVLAPGVIGACAATASLVGLVWILPSAHVGFVALATALVLTLGRSGFRAARHGRPEEVQNAVRTLVFGIVGLDTCVAWAAQGPAAACLPASLLIPAWVLSRRFRMT